MATSSADTANLLSLNKQGQTLLQLACLARDVTTVQSLLHKAEGSLSKHDFVNKRNISNPSALFTACRSGIVAIVELLIQHGADVTSQESDGQTCLHAASESGHPDIVRFLIKNVESKSKSDFINKQDRFKRTALYLACYKGNVDAVAILIANDSDVLLHDASGLTCLHVASMNNHAEVVATLLDTVDSDAKLGFVNGTDGVNRTALYFACEKGNADIVAKLLQHGADVRVCYEYNGYTCLHVASQNNHIGVIQLLLGHVDGSTKDDFVNKRCKYNHSALFWARERGHAEVVEFLKQNGAIEESV